jgi:hypothetical protein
MKKILFYRYHCSLFSIPVFNSNSNQRLILFIRYIKLQIMTVSIQT